MVTYIHKYGGGGDGKKAWAGIQVAVCVFTKHARFGVKQLRWVKKKRMNSPPTAPSPVFVYISHHALYLDLPLMKALDWAETSGKNCDNRHLPLDFLG